MDYEKKYKEALERAKEIKSKLLSSHLSTESCKAVSEYIDTIIPELAESEDERIRQSLLAYIKGESKRLDTKKWIAYLEKQKDIDKMIVVSPEVWDNAISDAFENGKKEGGKQKEQKPILEVFGFKVGDAVRLKDGDGRKHIIKSFEEIEGVHGPNFYHVEFEDNSARDGIYPGEEYPNGYYTQMEKFEEEQKPAEWSEKHIAGIFEKVGLAKIVREQGNDDLTNALQDAMLELSKVGNAEWSEDDEEMRQGCIDSVEYELLDNGKDDEVKTDPRIIWLKSLPLNLKKKNEDVAKLCSNEWSEEDEEMLNRIIETLSLPPIYDTKACAKMVAWLKSLRPQPQMLEDWTKEDEELLKDVLGCITLVQTYKACGDLEEFKMGHTGEELRSFVRSLKSRPRKQPHWKPSEEQMEALNALNCHGGLSYIGQQNLLISLYNDLKKLK